MTQYYTNIVNEYLHDEITKRDGLPLLTLVTGKYPFHTYKFCQILNQSADGFDDTQVFEREFTLEGATHHSEFRELLIDVLDGMRDNHLKVAYPTQSMELIFAAYEVAPDDVWVVRIDFDEKQNRHVPTIYNTFGIQSAYEIQVDIRG